MLIVVKRIFSKAGFAAATVGEIIEVSDAHGAHLIAAKYAEPAPDGSVAERSALAAPPKRTGTSKAGGDASNV